MAQEVLNKIAERFVPVKGYEGLYEISNYGRVKSLTRMIRSRYGNLRKIPEVIVLLNLSRQGYFKISLSKGGIRKWFRLNRLVAEHFIENTENKPFVNHIDCNKLNNFFENLEWCTALENNAHARRHNLIPKMTPPIFRGADNNKAIGVSQYDLFGKHIADWECISDAEKSLGRSRTNISACCAGRRNTALGYKWSYRN